DLTALRLDVARRAAARAAAKNDLDLIVVLQRADEGDPDVFNFQPRLFVQLAADGFFGLFARLDEAAGYAPAAPCAEAVFEQQDTATFVHDHRARRHGEARLFQHDAPAPDRLRHSPPQPAEKFSKQELLPLPTCSEQSITQSRWSETL